MRVEDMMAELKRREALIVHCSRPGRAGELDDSKPLYPEDLRATIRDLRQGGVRGISCSVVWPEHQETFGSVGIVVVPRTVADVRSMHPSDAGYSDSVGGLGAAPSPEAMKATFANSSGHNEWVVWAGDTVGLFISTVEAPEVARRAPVPDDLPEELRDEDLVGPAPITLGELRNDFPHLPVLGYVDGRLTEIAPALEAA